MSNKLYHVKVISTRVFKPFPAMGSELSKELTHHLHRLRDAAKVFPGYIDSATYHQSTFNVETEDLEAPRQNRNSTIISTWTDEIAWDNWYNSDKRIQISKEMDQFLAQEDSHQVLSKVKKDMPLL